MGDWIDFLDDVLNELIAQTILLAICFLLMTGLAYDAMSDAANARDMKSTHRQTVGRGRVTKSR